MKKRILIYTGGSIPTKEWDEISQEINKMQDFECVYRIGDSPESNIRPEYLCFKKLNELLQIKDSFVPNENFYKEVVPTFIDMFSRISFRGMAANRYVHYTYHEYINICVTLAKIFYQILINNKIDIIILNTIPYTGPDYLLTKIAEKLNIKVLFFYQSLIPNRFFPMTHINNLGKFKFKNLENEELNFNLPI